MQTTTYTPESMAARAVYLQKQGLNRRANSLWQQIITHPAASNALRAEACKACGVLDYQQTLAYGKPSKTLAGVTLPALRAMPNAREDVPQHVVITRLNGVVLPPKSPFEDAPRIIPDATPAPAASEQPAHAVSPREQTCARETKEQRQARAEIMREYAHYQARAENKLRHAREQSHRQGRKKGYKKPVNPDSFRQQVKKLLLAGYAVARIAEKLGTERARVRRVRNELNLRPQVMPTSASGRKLDNDFYHFCLQVAPLLAADQEYGRFKRIGETLGVTAYRVRHASLTIIKSPELFPA